MAIADVLPPGSPRRNGAWGLLVALLLAAITQLWLQTPLAIVFSGLTIGLVISLTAAGLVLIYRTQRFVNFAQTVIGGVGGLVTFNLMAFKDFPFLLALPIGLVLATLMGLLIEFAVIKRFFKQPRLVLTVVTIALAQAVPPLVPSVLRRIAPFVLPDEGAGLLDQLGQFTPPLPLAGFRFTIGSLPLEFGFAHVFAIEASILSLLVLAGFFRYTRAGVAVRGVAENADRATLLGISVGGLSSLVWMLAGFLSGVSVILVGLLTTPAVAQGQGPSIYLPALAAAVLARMRSLPVAVAGAVGIGILQASVRHTKPTHVGTVSVALFVVVVVGLLLQRRKATRSEAGEESSWQATEEQRPIPKELSGLSGVRATRIAFIALAAIGVLLLPFLATPGFVNTSSVVALTGIVALSLVVLTGWAGQVSLGQFSFVAIAAVVGGALVERVGVPFWLAIPIVSAMTAGMAVLIGLPALRIRGLFLAVVTFAFAVAVDAVLFNPDYFGWLVPESIDRPTAFVFDFQDETSMYFLCVGALALSLVAVVNLRRSRVGRVLIAARENEANLQAFGVNLVRTKLLAFAISGALCGFAGVLFAAQQGAVSRESFPAETSLEVFLYTVLGGVGSPAGALIGGAFNTIINDVVKSDFLRPLVGPGGVLVILFIAPGGLISLVNQVRDSALRIVAQRRQIVVPSLFADVDPAALEARLIPLSEPIPNSGLAALPPGQRYRQPSELYGDDGDKRRREVAGPPPPALAPASVGREG